MAPQEIQTVLPLLAMHKIPKVRDMHTAMTRNTQAKATRTVKIKYTHALPTVKVQRAATQKVSRKKMQTDNPTRPKTTESLKPNRTNPTAKQTAMPMVMTRAHSPLSYVAKTIPDTASTSNCACHSRAISTMAMTCSANTPAPANRWPATIGSTAKSLPARCSVCTT